MNTFNSAYDGFSKALHGIEPSVQRLWRASLLRRGVDITAPSSGRSTLVLAPHPDDESLGCGATIARKRAAGTAVSVVIAADGRHSHSQSKIIDEWQLKEIRKQEAFDACATLGAPKENVTQLGFEDTRLYEHKGELDELVEKSIRDTTPQEILVVSGRDWHGDHQVLNQSAREIIAKLGYDGTVLEFPVWYWNDGPWIDRSNLSTLDKVYRFIADPIRSVVHDHPQLVSTNGFLGKKQAALRAHKSQTSNYTGEDTWQVMDAAFLADFLGQYELFFPMKLDERVQSTGRR